MKDLVPSMGSNTQVHSCDPPSPSSDAFLLAEDCVRREALADERAHGSLGALVGDGHGRRVVLVVPISSGVRKVLDGDLGPRRPRDPRRG
jgi:hypothetical protein